MISRDGTLAKLEVSMLIVFLYCRKTRNHAPGSHNGSLVVLPVFGLSENVPATTFTVCKRYSEDTQARYRTITVPGLGTDIVGIETIGHLGTA